MTESSSRRTLLAAGAAAALASFLPASRAADASKTIVIWFSRTGSTEMLARSLVESLGADALKLELVEPYADEYSAMTDIAREEKRSGKRREIKTSVPDLSSYDLVYLGSPYWWGGISVPVATFLADHPLAGKRVKPFVVSASSSPEGAWADIRKACPRAHVEEGFHTTQSRTASSTERLLAWAKR